MRKSILITICAMLSSAAYGAEQFVTFDRQSGSFQIIRDEQPIQVCVSQEDYEGVQMATESLCNDIEAVCGTRPVMTCLMQKECIIIGSLESELIRQLVEGGKFDISDLEGKNEKYILTVVDRPAKGVDKALVIAGSDKRGTIYGIYELSRQMGVSPWYWWMDVPVAHKENVYIKKGIYTDGEPKVAYRGIFINDEWPSFGNWANEKFGGINSKCYRHMFELILRLKGNYLWPAMWGSAF